jgi:dTDP-4-dehydrorhamnose reductase
MSLPQSEDLPTLLVVGARGFVGGHVVQQGRGLYRVVRADRSRESDETDMVMDIRDSTSVRIAMDEVRPDVVVLSSAISDIDRCQREPKLAIDVNLRGAERVAEACARCGARLLFVSTGAVFDGRKIGYREEDEVSPLSVYGESKAQAETAVRALIPSAVIVRVSLVLGSARRVETNSMLDSMIRKWKSGKTISASPAEWRNPIDAGTLSHWMLELIADQRNCGIFHAGSTEAITRLTLACSIAERLHVPKSLVQEEREPPKERAPRGAHHWLLTDKINAACATQAPGYMEAIERGLNEFAEGDLRA